MTNNSLRIIAFGAHPDDCEILCGGLAAKLIARGDAVKFVSITNGNAGHQKNDRETIRQRRAEEVKQAAAVLGIEYEVLRFDDGGLTPSLEARWEVIRLIREWNADVVFSHRPNDYHPDHRYSSQIVQDAAYMVTVPLVCPNVPAMKKNPIFFYFWDHFTKPYPFQVDAVVAVDDAMEKKWALMHCHASQFYEWLPYVEGVAGPVPEEEDDRMKWLASIWSPWLKAITDSSRESLVKRYGDQAPSIQFAEAFELCEYGRQPSAEEMERIFPR